MPQTKNEHPAATLLVWHPASIPPAASRQIVMRGDSGYIAPHHTFLVSGRYDPQYRPLSPWLDSTGTCLADTFGENCVKFWAYVAL